MTRPGLVATTTSLPPPLLLVLVVAAAAVLLAPTLALQLPANDAGEALHNLESFYANLEPLIDLPRLGTGSTLVSTSPAPAPPALAPPAIPLLEPSPSSSTSVASSEPLHAIQDAAGIGSSDMRAPMSLKRDRPGGTRWRTPPKPTDHVGGYGRILYRFPELANKVVDALWERARRFKPDELVLEDWMITLDVPQVDKLGFPDQATLSRSHRSLSRFREGKIKPPMVEDLVIDGYTIGFVTDLAASRAEPGFKVYTVVAVPRRGVERRKALVGTLTIDNRLDKLPDPAKARTYVVVDGVRMSVSRHGATTDGGSSSSSSGAAVVPRRVA
ncbi:uncharacterized protein PFL1_05267 [Pseudozyma flocculosa PF-1]|uniref:Uncharacterized protein n=2 Tax=Pseudozyma flocculosa TaxID=84751 RepID=A0A5C3F5E8_9BASI|nr:uncharacterized protein PFL1_05267 [Pseudozyma flocculosa PF-1]EPQ27346.1 hypothetical protein PFL1_05267 [Pseudozyma flocculosa PF-1]SPO39724.1 uncharacterized protein PSFLO_05205 [Pseudozyma flocculosa]